MIDVTPARGIEFSRRLAAGGTTSVAAGAGAVPQWVKLVRSGSTFSGYRSSDGVAWTLIGTATITMANTVYVGLPVCSVNNGVLNTATLDGVTVTTLP